MMTVELKSVGVRARVFTVSTLREASKVCREFIAEHSLGNSSKGWTPETTEVLRDDLDKRF